jgi:hypothetical protein
LVHETTEE